MSELLLDYLPLVIFIGVAMAIGAALLVVPFLVAYKQPDPEKLSAYECGFNAFDDARMKFDVRFYLVAILFISAPQSSRRPPRASLILARAGRSVPTMHSSSASMTNSRTKASSPRPQTI
jgi:hypothetical protein